MSRALVVGVDPGQTTGIVALAYPSALWRSIVLECEPASVLSLVGDIVTEHPGYRALLAVEQFVVGTRAARSATSKAGRTTRELIAELSTLPWAAQSIHIHPAAVVKPWATDKRLDAAGLLAPTKGMGHARDGARHALFTAVHERIARDPLITAVG